MPWARATSPQPPAGEPVSGEVIEVEGGFVTPFERGELRRWNGRQRWIRGAAHDADGTLLTGSQRVWAGDPESPVAVDPARTVAADDAKRLAGTWLYGGHWMLHFGHFLVETLSSLWPEPGRHRADGLLFHRGYHGGDPDRRRGVLLSPEPRPWQARFLELAGYSDLPIRVVQSRPVSPERLLVPTRPVVFKAHAGPDAVAVWERIGAAAGPPGTGERVFLSRTAFHRDRAERVRTDQAWDAVLDDTFAAAGFEVVHPETLPLDRQIRLVRGAAVVAGAAGSGLHLSAFAGPTTRVLEVGDRRTPYAAGLTQRLVDAARGRESAFLPYGDPASLTAALAELAG